MSRKELFIYWVERYDGIREWLRQYGDDHIIKNDKFYKYQGASKILSVQSWAAVYHDCHTP